MSHDSAPLRNAGVSGGSVGLRQEVKGPGARRARGVPGAERDVVVAAYDGAELVDISCVTTGLDAANRVGARPPYRVRLASLGGRRVRCDSGLELRAQAQLEDPVDDLDTLVVSGGLGHDAAADDARLVGYVRRLAMGARRIASVCTGATVLAAAGLLDGRPVTTHWAYARGLAERYPGIRVDPTPIYIRDGKVATSAGVTAALDLTLAFIEEDHGPELARRVARGMVTYLKRPGNQAQMSLFTATPRPQDRLVRRVLDHIAANPGGDLRTAILAADAGVSVRHLTRLFREQLGEPPGRLVRRVRIELAARMLASTALPLPQVARACGFSSAETLRQAFVASYRITPSLFRATQSKALDVGRRRRPPRHRGQA
jgi:transcriptional regulator GlxA family with amidase domain